jgi:dTDP-4-amino-4,6-dideoxygalactose transaminase
VSKPATTHRAAVGAPIPTLDLKRQYAQIKNEVQEVIERVCSTQYFIGGEELQKFEQESAAFLGAKRAVGCASGTDALWLGLVALGVQPGDVVFTTPFSFFASASAIVRAGARPVFVDVDPATLNIDPKLVEAAFDRYYAKVIMPVHLYGQCADMDALEKTARENKSAILEDAAQAFGASWRGRRSGTFGRAAAFSFYPTKNLSAYGDGGLVTTNDDAIADHVRSLANHGSKQRYYHDEIGWNSRLDALQAAILRVKMKYIESWNKHRQHNAKEYDRLFRAAGLVAKSDTGRRQPLRLLHTAEQAFHIAHQYVVCVEQRAQLRKFLAEHKIGTEVYYPVPLHLQKCFAYLGYAAGDLPVSERAAEEVLALPMFPELTPEEQQRVVDTIAEFYS